MSKKKKSLAETHPEIAEQLHPTKNGDLTPNDFTSGSGKKVWWKCDKADDHEWFTSPNSRHINDGKFIGCPYCINRMPSSTNNLSILFPEISNELHPSKNGNIVASNLLPGSHKKMWWKCDKGDDHVWSASIVKRINGTGCPICSGRKVVKSNCLKTTHPDVAKMWHPTKNGDLTPYDITSGSGKKAWWKCDQGDDHEWFTQPNVRTGQNQNCPICSGRKAVLSNCLFTTSPVLAKEWHPSLNGGLTPFDVTSGSDKKAWWKCDQGDDHEWVSNIYNRSKGNNCPICSGRKAVLSNCLFTMNPALAEEWHPTKNNKLTPYDVVEKTDKKVWWKCDQGDDHEWISRIDHRANGSECPVCAGRKVVLSNCLFTMNPKLSEEWHPTRNGLLTAFEVTSGTHTKVWWKCDKGDDHEWRTSIVHRSNGKNCPFCTLTPQSKQELTITFELIQFFKDINPKGFKTIVKGKLWSIDIYIPQLKLGIEFDGSYWHKDKRALDKLKTEKLEEEGEKAENSTCRTPHSFRLHHPGPPHQPSFQLL